MDEQEFARETALRPHRSQLLAADRTPERLDAAIAATLGPERHARIGSSSLAQFVDVEAAEARSALASIERSRIGCQLERSQEL